MPNSDFNGDGRDDVLWRNMNGALSNWLGTSTGGFTVNDANALINVPTDWRVLNTGDFNGDGRADVLWQNTNGDVSNWLGTQSGGWIINDAAAYVQAVDPTWYVLGTGDFNDDGRDDLIWASEDIPGRQIWFAEADGGFGAPVPVGNWGTAWLQWHFATHVGDFNGDGRHDLLFTDNGSTFWTSLAIPSEGSIDVQVTPTASTDWHVAGIGDFNDDGFDDLLWRNSATGAVSNWLSTGTGNFIVNDAVAYRLVSASWRIEQVGDFNGDGNADILWRNDNGVVSDWLGNDAGGFVVNDANAWSPVQLEWVVRGFGSGAGYWDY